MKIKPGDILKYETEMGNPMSMIDLVISLEGNEYDVVPLGYLLPGETPSFWTDFRVYHMASTSARTVAGKIKIKISSKLRRDIIKGLFLRQRGRVI